ncbi:MAG TPA: exo-alpha-sialidase [Actinomycetota bacterium]|nr:exo-alpha-sialidase [Actinomycetota bacterium]
MAFNPADDKVYLATHDGLFRYDATGPVQVGPVIDLMGFTAAGPDHFYSSGHPGAGVDMPNPVGLIESTDAGQTWSALSRQGQTDFHSLTASKSGVVGFDGSVVLRTTDGKSWSALEPPVATLALATSPEGSTLLATSTSGPARSTDHGATWTVHPEAPLLQLAFFTDDETVVGVAPDGVVFVSTDAGATWKQRGGVGRPPQAVTARAQTDGRLEILVVTADALLRSNDSGSSFTG